MPNATQKKITIGEKRLAHQKIWRLLYPSIDHWRPTRRADCRDGVRPCPYVGCRYHLFLDFNEDSGSITYNFGAAVEIDEIPETCALDLAENEGMTLEDVGRCMNLTRERVRQVEESLCARIRDSIDPNLRHETDTRIGWEDMWLPFALDDLWLQRAKTW